VRVDPQDLGERVVGVDHRSGGARDPYPDGEILAERKNDVVVGGYFHGDREVPTVSLADAR
jgi:hypothetical protein